MTQTSDLSPDKVRKAELALIICAVLWSSSGIFIKLVDANPMVIAGGRSIIAFFVMLLFNRRPHFTWSPAQIGAGLAYTATMILFVAANKLTNSANAILLQYAAPVYVALLSGVFLQEKIRRREVLALAAILAGTVLFFVERVAVGNNFGNILAVLSGMAFGFTIVFMRMQKNESPSESFMISHVLTFLISIPFWSDFQLTWGNLGAIGGLGVFQIGLAGVFFSYGIKSVPAMAGALIVTLEPVLNPVWVFLATGETPSPLAFVGGAIIIVTVLALQISSLPKAQK